MFKIVILIFINFTIFFSHEKKIGKCSRINLRTNTAKNENPQIRPIENFWAISKIHVYKNNWSAKTHEHLIARIKKCAREIDLSIIQKMFDGLKTKIHRANKNGLGSLV